MTDKLTVEISLMGNSQIGYMPSDDMSGIKKGGVTISIYNPETEVGPYVSMYNHLTLMTDRNKFASPGEVMTNSRTQIALRPNNPNHAKVMSMFEKLKYEACIDGIELPAYLKNLTMDEKYDFLYADLDSAALPQDYKDVWVKYMDKRFKIKGPKAILDRLKIYNLATNAVTENVSLYSGAGTSYSKSERTGALSLIKRLDNGNLIYGVNGKVILNITPDGIVMYHKTENEVEDESAIWNFSDVCDWDDTGHSIIIENVNRCIKNADGSLMMVSTNKAPDVANAIEVEVVLLTLPDFIKEFNKFILYGILETYTARHGSSNNRFGLVDMLENKFISRVQMTEYNSHEKDMLSGYSFCKDEKAVYFNTAWDRMIGATNLVVKFADSEDESLSFIKTKNELRLDTYKQEDSLNRPFRRTLDYSYDAATRYINKDKADGIMSDTIGTVIQFPTKEGEVKFKERMYAWEDPNSGRYRNNRHYERYSLLRSHHMGYYLRRTLDVYESTNIVYLLMKLRTFDAGYVEVSSREVDTVTGLDIQDTKTHVLIKNSKNKTEFLFMRVMDADATNLRYLLISWRIGNVTHAITNGDMVTNMCRINADRTSTIYKSEPTTIYKSEPTPIVDTKNTYTLSVGYNTVNTMDYVFNDISDLSKIDTDKLSKNTYTIIDDSNVYRHVNTREECPVMIIDTTRDLAEIYEKLFTDRNGRYQPNCGLSYHEKVENILDVVSDSITLDRTHPARNKYGIFTPDRILNDRFKMLLKKSIPKDMYIEEGRRIGITSIQNQMADGKTPQSGVIVSVGLAKLGNIKGVEYLAEYRASISYIPGKIDNEALTIESITSEGLQLKMDVEDGVAPTNITELVEELRKDGLLDDVNAVTISKVKEFGDKIEKHLAFYRCMIKENGLNKDKSNTEKIIDLYNAVV